MLLFLDKTVDREIPRSELIELGNDIQQLERRRECLSKSKHINDCNDLAYPRQLGKRSRLGVATTGNVINRKQYNSSIYKIHLALSEDDFKSFKWKNKSEEERTSDNYVMYIIHPYIENCILVLGVISPDAHNKIQSNINLMNDLINEAEFFQELNEVEISICNKYFSPS